MDENDLPVNQNKPVSAGFDRLEVARAWGESDRSTPEPLLSAPEVRKLLVRTTGRGRAEETLLGMAERGEIPAYRDMTRRTRHGSNPIVFRWSEVAPLLVGCARSQGPASKFVRIVPAKSRR